jgi:poly(beta-D-mannuronate) lyase
MLTKAFSYTFIIVLISSAMLTACGSATDDSTNGVKNESSSDAIDGILVTSQEAFLEKTESLSPGDTIVLADGEWKNFEILFKGKGSEDKPITLKAQNKGKVILSGLSNLRLSGEHLIVEGLVFKNGYSPTGEVVSFRESNNKLATHSRVTEVVIDGFSNPDKFNSDIWVVLYGKNNRFDHSHLVGKNNAGVTVAVRLNTEDSQENHHRVDHNYFGLQWW